MQTTRINDQQMEAFFTTVETFFYSVSLRDIYTTIAITAEEAKNLAAHSVIGKIRMGGGLPLAVQVNLLRKNGTMCFSRAWMEITDPLPSITERIKALLLIRQFFHNLCIAGFDLPTFVDARKLWCEAGLQIVRLTEIGKLTPLPGALWYVRNIIPVNNYVLFSLHQILEEIEVGSITLAVPVSVIEG